ncbi:hypothetical protein M5X00_13280 [Paenibacillus alvei]|nr:hypothetical protein [Paenibacillus alvei]MCY9755213.1 hypothetical protein [Paenibacillus alvei]
MVPFENELNFDENGITGKVTIDNVDIWLGDDPEIWKNGKTLSKKGYDEALQRKGYIPIHSSMRKLAIQWSMPIVR